MSEMPFTATECPDHVDYPWVLMCAHMGEDVATLRDYHHPAYIDFYGKENQRFEVFASKNDAWDSKSFYQGHDPATALGGFRTAEAWLLTPRQEEE